VVKKRVDFSGMFDWRVWMNVFVKQVLASAHTTFSAKYNFKIYGIRKTVSN